MKKFSLMSAISGTAIVAVGLVAGEINFPFAVAALICFAGVVADAMKAAA